MRALDRDCKSIIVSTTILVIVNGKLRTCRHVDPDEDENGSHHSTQPNLPGSGGITSLPESSKKVITTLVGEVLCNLPGDGTQVVWKHGFIG